MHAVSLVLEGLVLSIAQRNLSIIAGQTNAYSTQVVNALPYMLGVPSKASKKCTFLMLCKVVFKFCQSHCCSEIH